LQGERTEFAAYGLLYAAASAPNVLAHELTEVFRAQRAASAGAGSSIGGGGGGGLTAAPGGLAADRFVGHALAACRAYGGGDFVRFLRLYEDAPRMAPYLMDLMLAKLRPRAYGAPLLVCLCPSQGQPLACGCSSASSAGQRLAGVFCERG
jgi:hypothetical protein